MRVFQDSMGYALHEDVGVTSINHQVAHFEAYPGSALDVFPCYQPPRLETVSRIKWQ